SFNGEIYNYQSLRSELESQGYLFQSTSDTEVALTLYAVYGEKCLSKLRGMFAFIIWDEQQKSAFAARDPFGIKPLYYWHDDETCVLGSELRSIIKTELSNTGLNPQGLYSYFKMGSVSEPMTLINDIHLLEAGHYLTWHAGQIKTNAYWQITFPKATNMQTNSAIKQTRAALESTVKAHLVSDVPVGIFLSGGIDSTALVALASQFSNQAINTYSIAFQNPAWNEGDIAKRVANHFGTNHTELVMTPELAESLFEQYIRAIDQPSIDGFNTFCVSKLAHDHGEKVVLSGVGADELFAGYKSFSLLPKMLSASKAMSIFAPVTRLINRLFKTLLPAKLRRAFDFIGQPNSLNHAHQSLRGIFSHDEAIYLSKRVCEQSDLSVSQTSTDPEHAHLKDQISDLELTRYLRNQLLRDSDVMSMHWGLELRTPFVDSVLFDSIANIPADIRLSQGKRLLIDSVPEIPDWVVNRPKQGFRFPFDEWFANHWQKSPTGIDIPWWIKLLPWYRRWSLVVLNKWINLYGK
ncbi:MAG: asparagine synthase (glutamine-hydrolyzing), partial [Acidiferrobacterales bacterium]|nr:asparagine synthase (glutamine-hydrolyzing) [Acidiferrobacterales bacterium]